jgi:hypothetical protein
MTQLRSDMTGPNRPGTGPERKTTVLLAIGIALLALQIWPLMPLPGMQLSDIIFTLAFAQFLWARFEIPPVAASAPIAAFAAGAAVSTLFGGSPVKLLGHFELAALGWMAACASPYCCGWLRRALVIAAALAALTAMAGLAVFFSGVAGYDAAGRPDSPLLYIHGSLVSDNYPRPRGTLVTGAMLTSVVATGFALLWFERELVPGRWLRRLIYAVCLVALFFAFSRAIATLAIVLGTAELWRRDCPRWARGAGVVAAAVYATALWISLRYEIVLNPLEPWAVDVLTADGNRYGIWRVAVATLVDNPIVGIGPGMFVAESLSAHNTWLNLWAGLGIVPLAAFALLMLASVRAAIGSHAPGLACALIFALIESSYNDIEDMRHVWLLIGIALSLRRTEPWTADNLSPAGHAIPDDGSDSGR